MVAIDGRLLAGDGLGDRISGEVKGWHDDLNSFQASYRQKEGAPSYSWALPAVLAIGVQRSEEHTSELQSLRHLVCRLLLEKKKKQCVQKTQHEIACFKLSMGTPWSGQ